jgi:hypothetical protein
MGFFDAARRAFRHPTLQTWISREEWSVIEVQNKIDATERAIAETETELANAALASTLADDGAAEELATKLDKLRTRKSVLLQALARAEQLEADRVAEATEREAASAARAARQHASRMVRAARECSAHIEALQHSFDTMASAADAAAILLPLPVRFRVADLLAEHRLRELVKAEAHRHARKGVHQFIRSQEAPAARLIEDFATSAMPSLEKTVGEIAEAVRRALSPEEKNPAQAVGGPSALAEEVGVAVTHDVGLLQPPERAAEAAADA